MNETHRRKQELKVKTNKQTNKGEKNKHCHSPEVLEAWPRLFCSDPGNSEHLDFQEAFDKYLTKIPDKKLIEQIATGRGGRRI